MSKPVLASVIASIREKAAMLDIEILEINGYLDHVHVLLQTSPKYKISEIIGQLKGYSSRMNAAVTWQIGYSAFSLHEDFLPTTSRYIRNQENHHRSKNYKEEITALRKKNKIR